MEVYQQGHADNPPDDRRCPNRRWTTAVKVPRCMLLEASDERDAKEDNEKKD